MKTILWFFFASTCIATPVIEGEDLRILKPFFKYLVRKESLGYVLLGEKPAIYIGYVDHLSWWHPIDSFWGWRTLHEKGNQHKKKAWETWKKYSSGISQRFVITEELSATCPHCNRIFIINRDLFCKVVQDHSDVFERVLKRKVTGEELLEQARNHPLFQVVLHHNEELLGLILGFGKGNARRYAERRNMREFGSFPMKGDNDNPIELPTFRADWDDPESHQLRERYLQCREKVRTTFLQDRIAFEEVLHLLFEDANQETERF